FFGAFSVAAGEDAGIGVNKEYWRSVEKHWTETQLASGAWGYTLSTNDARLNMTAAGVAALLFTHDRMDAGDWGRRPIASREPYAKPLSGGLDYLDHGGLDVMGKPLFYIGYCAFINQQAASASGFKQF